MFVSVAVVIVGTFTQKFPVAAPPVTLKLSFSADNNVEPSEEVNLKSFPLERETAPMFASDVIFTSNGKSVRLESTFVFEIVIV